MQVNVRRFYPILLSTESFGCFKWAQFLSTFFFIRGIAWLVQFSFNDCSLKTLGYFHSFEIGRSMNFGWMSSTLFAMLAIFCNQIFSVLTNVESMENKILFRKIDTNCTFFSFFSRFRLSIGVNHSHRLELSNRKFRLAYIQPQPMLTVMSIFFFFFDFQNLISSFNLFFICLFQWKKLFYMQKRNRTDVKHFCFCDNE